MSTKMTEKDWAAALDVFGPRPAKVRRPLLTGWERLRQDESCRCSGWENGYLHAQIIPMVLPGSDLPDDVDALKAMILAMAREQAANEALDLPPRRQRLPGWRLSRRAPMRT